MCMTFLCKTKTKTCYGYKVVRRTRKGNAVSTSQKYIFKKGYNNAASEYVALPYVESPYDVPHRIKRYDDITDGMFHCFKTLANANLERTYPHYSVTADLCTIKVRLIGTVYHGEGQGCFEDQKHLGSARIYWNGKFLPN